MRIKGWRKVGNNNVWYNPQTKKTIKVVDFFYEDFTYKNAVIVSKYNSQGFRYTIYQKSFSIKEKALKHAISYMKRHPRG